MTPRRTLIAAAALALSVPGAYLALGGGSYETPGVANPCDTREWRNPEGIERVAEQIVLSTLDGVACEIRVTREALVLALATPESRRELAGARGLNEVQFEAVVRRGLDRAVTDAERAGALAGWQAALLREAAERVPLDSVLDAVGVLG